MIQHFAWSDSRSTKNAENLTENISRAIKMFSRLSISHKSYNSNFNGSKSECGSEEKLKM